jgi:hypothetical protein
VLPKPHGLVLYNLRRGFAKGLIERLEERTLELGDDLADARAHLQVK